MQYTNPTIRKISPTEVKTLRALALTTFIDTYASANTPSNIERYLAKSFSLEKLTQELQHPQSQFYFVESQGKALGYLKVNYGEAQTDNTLPDALEVERIYVLKAHQGKKIGHLFIQKAIEIATSLQLKRIWLGVWEENPKAIAFYKKTGFVEFGEHNFQFGEEAQVDIMMKMELD